eukprot:TRINITY_DN6878_c0_g1_i7.p1 TRINITY_DN6878_c0_g1~~TRINITY_DN6878_c0_g1_i7.p1  ORF type:complete len:682 (-),score=70.75 TRINITY_DN6878_c0_g1_i7:46-2091(-)
MCIRDSNKYLTINDFEAIKLTETAKEIYKPGAIKEWNISFNKAEIKQIDNEFIPTDRLLTSAVAIFHYIVNKDECVTTYAYNIKDYEEDIHNISKYYNIYNWIKLYTDKHNDYLGKPNNDHAAEVMKIAGILKTIIFDFNHKQITVVTKKHIQSLTELYNYRHAYKRYNNIHFKYEAAISYKRGIPKEAISDQPITIALNFIAFFLCNKIIEELISFKKAQDKAKIAIRFPINLSDLHNTISMRPFKAFISDVNKLHKKGIINKQKLMKYSFSSPFKYIDEFTKSHSLSLDTDGILNFKVTKLDPESREKGYASLGYFRHKHDMSSLIIMFETKTSKEDFVVYTSCNKIQYTLNALVIALYVKTGIVYSYADLNRMSNLYTFKDLQGLRKKLMNYRGYIKNGKDFDLSINPNLTLFLSSESDYKHNLGLHYNNIKNINVGLPIMYTRRLPNPDKFDFSDTFKSSVKYSTISNMINSSTLVHGFAIIKDGKRVAQLENIKAQKIIHSYSTLSSTLKDEITFYIHHTLDIPIFEHHTMDIRVIDKAWETLFFINAEITPKKAYYSYPNIYTSKFRDRHKSGESFLSIQHEYLQEKQFQNEKALVDLKELEPEKEKLGDPIEIIGFTDENEVVHSINEIKPEERENVINEMKKKKKKKKKSSISQSTIISVLYNYSELIYTIKK